MSEKIIAEFKEILGRVVLLNEKEKSIFDKIPLKYFNSIFYNNFNGDLVLAEKILTEKYDYIESHYYSKLDNEKRKIYSLNVSAKKINEYIKNNKKIVFLTDYDNDGSLAQSAISVYRDCVAKQYSKSLANNLIVEYASPLTQTRGFSLENLERALDFHNIKKSDDFLIITADNGIDNREEQERIQQKYENSFLIITDHHLPDSSVILENSKTLIVNPNYKPTPFFKTKNISGADTCAVLLKESLLEFKNENIVEDIDESLKIMTKIGRWGNLIDWVESDIADKPLRSYIIELAQKYGALLNVINNFSNIIENPEILNDKNKALIEGVFSKEDSLKIYDSISKFFHLNEYSRKLLAYFDQTITSGYYPPNEEEFFTGLSDILIKDSDSFELCNKNYIQQLRPILYKYLSAGSQNNFEKLFSELIEIVFNDLKYEGKKIQEIMRKNPINGLIKRDNVTFLYSKHLGFESIFKRRFLGQTYNEENNGLLVVLNEINQTEIRGSMRSLADSSLILKNKKIIENSLNIKIEVIGHERAAGFRVTSTINKPIDNKLIDSLAVWLNQEYINNVKSNEYENQYLKIDYNSVGLISKINGAVKANLSHMKGLRVILEIEKNNSEIWITDNKTTEQLKISECANNKNYGYLTIKTDFKDGSFIVPVEMFKSAYNLPQNNVALKLNFINNGVFIANQIAKKEDFDGAYDIRVPTQEAGLTGYYKENFSQNKTVNLSRDDFYNLPYFRYNRFGKKEFEQWESLMIELIYKTGCDIWSVIDTEGTGLGKAPKCFNIGSTNIKIKDGSGYELSLNDFNKNFYIDKRGKMYLLSDSDTKNLTQSNSHHNSSNGLVNDTVIQSDVIQPDNVAGLIAQSPSSQAQNSPNNFMFDPGSVALDSSPNLSPQQESAHIINKATTKEKENVLIKMDGA